MGLLEVTKNLEKRVDLLQDYILAKFGSLDFEAFVKKRNGACTSRKRKLIDEQFNSSTTTVAPFRRTQLLGVDTDDSTLIIPDSPEDYTFEAIKNETNNSDLSSSMEEEDEESLDDFDIEVFPEQEDLPADGNPVPKKFRPNFRRHSCLMPGCTTTLRKVTKNLSWHRFPTTDANKVQRDEWISVLRDIIKDQRWTPKTTDRICSRHFSTQSITPSKTKNIISSWAVPSLNLTDLLDSSNSKSKSNRSRKTASTVPSPDEPEKSNNSRMNIMDDSETSLASDPLDSNNHNVLMEIVKFESDFIEEDFEEFIDEDVEPLHSEEPVTSDLIFHKTTTGQIEIATDIQVDNPEEVGVRKSVKTNQQESRSSNSDQNEVKKSVNKAVKKSIRPVAIAPSISEILLTETTSRGKPKIQRKGYAFYYHKSGVGKYIWECSKRRSNRCHARLHTSESFCNPNLLFEIGTHSHSQDITICSNEIKINPLNEPSI